MGGFLSGQWLKALRPSDRATIILGILLFVLPFFTNDYVLTVMTLAGIYAIACIGLNLFMGYTGQISFGHNAFAALGGYSSAILTTQYGWGPLPAGLAGIALSIGAALLVGYPTLRLHGHYLAMATMALGIMVTLLAVQLDWITNGYTGIAAIPPLGLGSIMVKTVQGYYAVIWLVAALAFWISVRIIDSRVGLALRAVRENEDAARALGVNVTNYKVLALVVSAILCSAAGSLYAHFISYVSPEAYGTFWVVLLFTMLLAGGRGTSLGPVFGAILIGFLPEILSSLKGYRELIYGIVLLVILIVAPRGLYGVLVHRFEVQQRRVETPPTISPEGGVR
jgi:branched-chain amino acid transport system permease protein